MTTLLSHPSFTAGPGHQHRGPDDVRREPTQDQPSKPTKVFRRALQTLTALAAATGAWAAATPLGGSAPFVATFFALAVWAWMATKINDTFVALAATVALLAGGANLRHARSLNTDNLHPRLKDVDIIFACNIHNVLTGKRGVARVFGPQKGATPQQVEELEAGLENFARLLHDHFQPAANVMTGPGSRASGGLGAGLMALGAQARNRFEVLLDKDLDKLLAQADVVITAEGAIDFQTPRGKVPAEIARRCQDSGVPVLALAGSLGHGAPAVHDCGIAAIQSIMTVPMELSDAVSQGRPLLVAAAERAMRMLQLGCAVAGRTEAKFRARYHAPVTVLPAA